MQMAIYHCSIKIIGRGGGRSAVGAAAYRSGSRLYEEETGTAHDYTRKMEIMHSEINLPQNAPEEYADRENLWNAVHKVEKNRNAQLAREVEVALPVEFSRDRQIEAVRDYVKTNFVDAGMCADWSIHDKGAGNPHAHIMLTTRAIKSDGRWAAKETKTFALDENGDRIPLIDKKTGVQKIGRRNEKLWKRVTEQANDWNDKNKAEEWRRSWAETCNKYLEPEKQIDHRSYQRQKNEKMPTIHEGYKARQMERDGIVSIRCEYNRTIRSLNAARSNWRIALWELQWSIHEKAEDLIGRINERAGGHDDDFEKSGEAADYHRGTGDGDRESENTERETNEFGLQIAEKGDDISGRIENLLQRRRNGAGSQSGRRFTGRERQPAEPDRGNGTDTFIRDAEADVANLLNDVNNSRLRAAASGERRRNCESERNDREVQRQRLDLERERKAQRTNSRSYEMER